MSSISARKVLFFIAGVSPTISEQALIDAVVGAVQVRSVLQSSTFGGNLEACDAVAGLSSVIPEAYSNTYSDVTPALAGRQVVVEDGQSSPLLTSAGTSDHLTTALTGTNNDMVFTAVDTGVPEVAVSIEYLAQSAAGAPLSVTVKPNRVVSVKLANDTGAKQKDTATVVGTITPAAKQVETATAAGTLSGTSGNVSVTVTAAGLAGSPLVLAVPTLTGDTASVWAGKVRTFLAANAAIAALFDVSGATTAIIITRKVFAANDGTLNIALATGTATGVTPAATSANTTAGTLGGGGNAAVVITSADLTGSPITLAVPVIESDTASIVAQKIRDAISRVDAIVGVRPNRASTAKFTVGGTGATVSLLRTIAKANDGTLNISVDNGTCTGLTTAATSANTIAGAAVAISTTAAQIKTAIDANPEAAALVTVANAAANNGTGIVTALAATALVGSVDPTTSGDGILKVTSSGLVGVTTS